MRSAAIMKYSVYVITITQYVKLDNTMTLIVTLHVQYIIAIKQITLSKTKL